MTKLNVEGTNKLLNEVTKTLIQWHPNATYSAESTGTDMRDFVRMTIKHYGLTRSEHLQDLLLFRQSFERAIAKRYKVKFTYSLGEDLEVKYRKKKVPQAIQIKSGVLDLLIGELNTVRINMNSIYKTEEEA